MSERRVNFREVNYLHVYGIGAIEDDRVVIAGKELQLHVKKGLVKDFSHTLDEILEDLAKEGEKFKIANRDYAPFEVLIVAGIPHNVDYLDKVSSNVYMIPGNKGTDFRFLGYNFTRRFFRNLKRIK